MEAHSRRFFKLMFWAFSIPAVLFGLLYYVGLSQFWTAVIGTAGLIAGIKIFRKVRLSRRRRRILHALAARKKPPLHEATP